MACRCSGMELVEGGKFGVQDPPEPIDLSLHSSRALGWSSGWAGGLGLQ